MRVLALHRDLRQRQPVEAHGDAVPVGVGIVRLVAVRDIGIVVFVTAEKVELLLLVADAAEEVQDVVARLDACGAGALAHRRLPVRGGAGREVALDRADGGGVAHEAPVGVAADGQVRPRVGEVEGAEGGVPLDAGATCRADRNCASPARRSRSGSAAGS